MGKYSPNLGLMESTINDWGRTASSKKPEKINGGRTRRKKTRRKGKKI